MSELSPAHAAELVRLMEYVAELRKLVAQYDRTLPRFRWYLTENLWFEVRSMISSESAESVDRTQAERDAPNTSTQRDRAVGAGSEPAISNLVWFTKIELFGGPADGQVYYRVLPLSKTFVADAISINGRRLKPRYRPAADELGETVAFESGDIGVLITREELDKAFAGKRSTKYSFVALSRRRQQ